MTIDIDRLTEAELIDLNVDSHSWRVRGITAYLENGSLLEHAQAMAGHVSARRMKLYDCRGEQVSLDEVERIILWRFKPLKGGLGSNWQDGSRVITNAGNCRGQ